LLPERLKQLEIDDEGSGALIRSNGHADLSAIPVDASIRFLNRLPDTK
jgi:hypothetical protein